MDSVRYYLALFLVMFAPGAYLFWFSIHPFVRWWRRLGAIPTLILHYGAVAGIALLAFHFRQWLLAVEYGTNWLLVALAVPIYAVALVVRFQLSRCFPVRFLLGLPELAPQRYGSRLVTEGIYGRVRHPRYLEMCLAILAVTLAANYLAGYAVAVLGLAWIQVVAPLEERELRARFGAEYEAYCAHVPRFLPRLGRRR